ncbi:MAG: alanyl-tRNA editing protein AlaXM [Nanopusillaceae archaeon]
MTKLLYWYDSYLKEFSAKVIEIFENKVVLDQTIFHPRSGGVANDTGEIMCKEEKYKVIDVYKEDNKVIHVLDRNPSFNIGDIIYGVLDWNRRYNLMKLHTAAHIISAILYRDYKAMVSGGEITPEYGRDDYTISHEDWKLAFEESVKKANDIIERGLPVKVYFLKRNEAVKIPGIVKLLEKAPPNIEEWRIVEIENIDIQADGGLHVSNTKEIGKIKIIKMENRGKDKKRLYFALE